MCEVLGVRSSGYHPHFTRQAQRTQRTRLSDEARLARGMRPGKDRVRKPMQPPRHQGARQKAISSHDRQPAHEAVGWLRRYNGRRLHSTPRYLSPMPYKQRWLTGQPKTANM